MRNLSVDLETRSSADIKSTGLYRYAQDEDFEILLFAYAFDDDPVQLIDLKSGEKLPKEIIDALADPNIIKHAHNAAFEWYCLNQAGYSTPLESWRCDMIHGFYCGYPGALGELCKALGVPEDKQKMTAGKALIRYFCVPRKPTKNNPKKYNDPEDAPEKWKIFKEYCIRDVETEMENERRLSAYPVPDSEWHLWHLDVAMNAHGVHIDTDLVHGALEVNDRSVAELTRDAVAITGLENPNSTVQLVRWINEQGVSATSVNKESLEDLLASDIPDSVRQMLNIRKKLGMTSIKKYVTADTAVCKDGYMRGISQFYGANRTGRYAGRILQAQNLTKNHIDTLDFARNLVKAGDYESIKFFYGNVPDLLSQLVRTMFIPSEGHHMVVSDFSAIEARVIAWISGETWANEEFAGSGKIYEATAAQMFGVPKEKIRKGNPEYALRQKGKVATLALGYAGTTGALINMGALKMGLSEDELPELVQLWRNANPHIVQFWRDCDAAVKTVMNTAKPVKVQCVTFRLEGDLKYGQCFMTIELPTGRKLYYPRPHWGVNRFGKMALHYSNMDQQTKKWGVAETHGGKLVENCLAGDTIVLTDHGWKYITEVGILDKLWDGDAWVAHGGLVEKGTQEVIDVNGIRCTKDHKILTSDGWKNASKSEGFDRYEIRLPDGNCVRWIHWKEISVEIPMRLWEGVPDGRIRVPEAETEILRMHERKAHQREDKKAWDVKQADMECMALNEGKVRDTNRTILEELWRPWDSRLQEMERKLRGLLRGHGAFVPEGVDIGQDRREQGLLSRKLPMGDSKGAEQQQKEQQTCGYSTRCDDSFPSIRGLQDWENNSALQTGSRSSDGITVRETGRYEPVYDILNAGPKHRFTVLTDKGPMVVHNCVQAIARDCLTEILLRVEKKGWQTVFHVHDELIVDAPMDVTSDDLCELMSEPIPWAPGLVLRGAGFESMYYMKD